MPYFFSAEIGLFYFIYYICLAGFFAATLAVFYLTIDDYHPKLQGSSSLLKGNPGMGFKPMPDLDTTLIYSTNDLKENEKYVKSISKVLDVYNETKGVGKNCKDETGLRPEEKEPCLVDFEALTSECNHNDAYGMQNAEPCVLLKLNKIFGWEPELYSKEEIQEVEGISQYVKDNYEPDKIWIDCQGENPADKDFLAKGQIEYYPQRGFPLAYFPYSRQEGYKSPLIFVKFINLPKHFAYMIECKAVAKNIAVDREEKEGSVHFELLID